MGHFALSLALLTVFGSDCFILVSLQAHKEHEGQKSRAQECCLGRWGEVDWKKESLAGFPPGFGSSSDDWL